MRLDTFFSLDVSDYYGTKLVASCKMSKIYVLLVVC